MKRREFLEKSGCAVPCALAAQTVFGQAAAQPQAAQSQQQPQTAPPRRGYKMEVEIFEAKEDSRCHKKGDKFEIPKDMGRICPWLLGSMHDFLVVLASGGTLSWKYEGTPYQKVIDPDGVTTEFVRCPDPTANLVAKIIRTKMG